MKWAALVILLAAIIPLSGWIRQNPRETPKFWMLMGFLPFVLGRFHLYMALISWPDWSGYVKGAEFSIIDALALAVYFTLPRARHPLPFRVSMMLYFFAVLLSVLQAGVPLAALFYPVQLARMFLVYAVVTRACADPRVVPAILKGMAAGLLMQASLAIWQRFALGMLHADGTFEHQNLLGLISHLIVFPFFAMLLVRRGWLPAAVVLAAIVVEVLTASRATLGLAGLGFGLVLMFSILRQWTSRKAMFGLIGLAAVAAITPVALSAFALRGEDALKSSDEERVTLETAATMMISDHPLGVGANNYVVVANVGGYNNRAGVVPVPGSGSAQVHNIYLLVAAETGYPGLITFALLLLRPLTVALRCSWRNRRDERGDLLLGLGVGMAIVYVHSFFEWIFITFEPQYMFALTLGLVAGLAEQVGYWRRFAPRGARYGAGDLFIKPEKHSSAEQELEHR